MIRMPSTTMFRGLAILLFSAVNGASSAEPILLSTWNVNAVPIHFKYDGKDWPTNKQDWKVSAKEEKGTSQYVLDHSPTGLHAEVTAHSVDGFDASEWIVRFTHQGKADSPILEDVQPGSFTLPKCSGTYELHYAEGSCEKETDFQPLEKKLDPGATVTLSPSGGRSSDGVLPYFHIVDPSGGGWILGIGWTGQWKGTFACDQSGNVTIQLGMEKTHLKLHPGESIRTPAILVMRHEGDIDAGRNQFRRLMLTHYTPTFGGKPFRGLLAASGATIGFNNFSEENQKQSIKRVADHHLPFDCWWIDAGWEVGGFPHGQGNAAFDTSRFPNGLGPIGNAAHADGLKFLLWFEPERVMRGTNLHREHADWLLAPTDLPPHLEYQRKDGFFLLDFGNPAALAWAKKHYSDYIRDFHVDIYRQDANLHPMYYWRNGEAIDRQGMREIRYVEGLYDFLDTLLREHPGLLIDNCASGGRRIDFEMMRRSIPLWRSDNCWKPVPTQSMTWGLSRWLPLTGVGAISTDPYDFRSGMGAHMSLALDYHKPDGTFWEPLAERVKEFREMQPYYAGDFYPLTPYTTSNDAWMGWQCHRTDLNAGLIQAFRRAGAKEDSITVKLHGFEPTARYEVRDLDGGKTEYLGRELMEGFVIERKAAPAACLFTYKMKKLQDTLR